MLFCHRLCFGLPFRGDIIRNSFDEYKTDDLDQYGVSKCSSVFIMKVMYKKRCRWILKDGMRVRQDSKVLKNCT